MAVYEKNAVIMAPLSGYTDLPYRLSLRRHGCRYCFTEMVDAGSISYGNQRGLRYLERHESEKWLGVQLVGCQPERVLKAVQVLNDYNFDILDFNLGCPAPKVAKKGAGAALGRKIEDAVKIFELIEKNSNKPVTAKIRIIAEENPDETIRLVKMLTEAGAQAITIHGRIMKKFYSGNVFFEHIKACKEAVKTEIIVNGGIMNYNKYLDAKKNSNCDKVMLARGAMGNPWLFDEIQNHNSFIPPTPQQLAEEMKIHLNDMAEYYGEQHGMIVGRKIILDYMKGRGYNKEIKTEISQLKTLNQFSEIVKKIADGPTPRYWQWLKGPDASERLLSHPDN